MLSPAGFEVPHDMAVVPKTNEWLLCLQLTEWLLRLMTLMAVAPDDLIGCRPNGGLCHQWCDREFRNLPSGIVP